MSTDHSEPQSHSVGKRSRRIAAPGFHLANSLDSGQCFRWEQIEDGFEGVVDGRVLRVAQTDRFLRFQRLDQTTGEEDRCFIRRYFDLDRDYQSIFGEIRSDPAIDEAVAVHPGIHILRQDPFETLISFIASSNNNIKRIRRIAALLSAKFGEPVDAGGKRYFRFPSAERLAEAPTSALRHECNLGFRDRYVKSAARAITDGEVDLQRLAEMESAALRAALLEIDGVGEKVAHCIMLFGFGRLEAFPVDTWVQKAMTVLYFGGKPTPLRVIRDTAREKFGDWAGVAQQYLFHSARVRRALNREA